MMKRSDTVFIWQLLFQKNPAPRLSGKTVAITRWPRYWLYVLPKDHSKPPTSPKSRTKRDSWEQSPLTLRKWHVAAKTLAARAFSAIIAHNCVPQISRDRKHELKGMETIIGDIWAFHCYGSGPLLQKGIANRFAPIALDPEFGCSHCGP